VPRGSGRNRPQVDTDKLLDIGTAVRAREVLRFDYEAVGGAAAPANGSLPPPRRVEPHHVVTWGGRWYLVAWDLDRADWRTFRVDRMTPKTPTGPRFTPRDLPAPDVAAFIAERFRRPAWPVTGEAVLHAPASLVARWAGTEALVEELAEDRCRLVMGSWSWTGLAAALGMFDADLEIVGPPELREAASGLAERYRRAVG
jgi:predicted DNA-binding transcriptional regulator YafY